MNLDPLVWLSVFWVLACISYLWKDNPAWRVTETVVIAVSAGDMFNVGVASFRSRIVTPASAGSSAAILGLLIGIFVFARYIPRAAWLIRYPTAFMWGIGCALTMTTAISGNIVGYVIDIAKMPIGLDWFIATTGLISGICFLIFLRTGRLGPHGARGTFWKYFTKWGQTILYVAIGFHAARYSYKLLPDIIERVSYVLRVWLQII